MKRAFPQKVKSVPSCETETKLTTGQPRQAPVETGRRVRTSAALIGLAVSMGAHGLLLPQSGDSAIAAEPVSGDAAATGTPASRDLATLHSSPDAASTVVEHVVQPGQTLREIARFYSTDAATVAEANGIAVDAPLRPGQVLKVPGNDRVPGSDRAARAPRSESSVTAAPEYYGLVSSKPASEPAIHLDTALKGKQETALTRLQQKRESLRQGLAQLKTDRQSAPAVTVPTIAQSVPAFLESPPASQSAAPVAAPQLKQDKPTAIAIQPDSTPDQGVPTATEQSKAIARSTPALQAPEQKPVADATTRYQITPGDTLSAIARRYGISQKQLAEANSITDPNLIRADQLLVIPTRATQASRPGMGEPAPNAATSDPASSAVSTKEAASPEVSKTAQLIESRLQPPAKFQAALPPVPRIATAADLQVATASVGNEAPQPEDAVTRQGQVENLRQEIVRLRERYSTGTAKPATRVAATSLSRTGSSDVRTALINPEFNPQAYADSQRVQSGLTRFQERVKVQPTAPKGQSQQVATAALGSHNYEPLIPSALGQMVSPDLPPLGSVDAYLPGASGKFNGYIWPAKGVLTSGYGWRWGRMHKGIDIAGPIGTPVMAAASGVVSYAGWNAGGYGNLVEITHPDGSVTLYAHNDRLLVREGQQIGQGEQIAEMGSTGYSTGPHSHFEVHLPGQGAVNPMAHLPSAGA